MTRPFSLQDGSPAPMEALKPPGWRKPDLPREHVCATCQGAATCGIGNVWFCVPHAPADFWPGSRA